MALSKTKYLIFAVMGFMVAAPMTVSAQTSVPLSGLYACESVADKEAQLSCFRTETAKLRVAETSGDLSVVETDSVAQFEQAKQNRAKAPKKRTLAISSTSTYGRKGYIQFTLENGEIWQQTEAERVRLGKAEPDMLTIKKASFGSFLARVNDKGTSIRVKRIK